MGTISRSDVERYGRRVRRALERAEAYQRFLPEGTWQAGGCALLARTLASLIPDARISAVLSSTGTVEHLAASIEVADGTLYLDAEGASDATSLLRRMREVEMVRAPQIVPGGAELDTLLATSEIMHGLHLESDLRAYLEAHAGRFKVARRGARST